MPKMKTKKSAAKRFKVRANGSIKRGQAFKRHILTKNHQGQAPVARCHGGTRRRCGVGQGDAAFCLMLD